MLAADHSISSANRRPFAATADKYNAETASGRVVGSNFPYDEVRRLPGYTERRTPGLSATVVTSEIARHLAEYAERNGCPLGYGQRDISQYIWMQASRRMLPWPDILDVVRAARKKDRHNPIAHYFGYSEIVERDGSARNKRLLKLIRYIAQEGECERCGTEFRFEDLTVDHIKPRKENGKYELPNVQLMCQPCNNAKGSSYI